MKQTKQVNNPWTITALTVAASNTGYKLEAIVKIAVDAKYWSYMKRNRQLGFLYGVDVSNEVYRRSCRLIPAHNPSVDDRKRASAGIKSITLTYYFDSVENAYKLGIECHKTKEGLIPKFSSYVNLLNGFQPRELV